MNANIGEENVIADKTVIIEENIKEKIKGKNIIYRFVKRVIDIIGGLVGIVLLIPVTVCVYLARKILKEYDGPLFYEQLRIGKNGKVFKMYKYSTRSIHSRIHFLC